MVLDRTAIQAQVLSAIERNASFIALGFATAACIMYFGRAGLAQLAVLIDARPSYAAGLAALTEVSAKTIVLISLAACLALAINACINALLLSIAAFRKPVYSILVSLAALPLLSLIPAWFTFFGDGWMSGFWFLCGCMCLYISLATVNAIIRSGPQIKQVIKAFPIRPLMAFRMLMECLLVLAGGELYEVLVLSVPFSIGAEIVAGRGGLGDVATMAYRNGNFAQLLVVASAYIVVFGIVLALAETAKLVGRNQHLVTA